MKRIISCILAILLVLASPSVFAEDGFVLRNGIQFGDTMDEVKEKETLEIKSVSENEIRTVSGELAGENVEAVIYRFNEDGKLVSVLWEVLNSRNSIIPPLVFDSLETAMKSKYGAPNHTDIQSSFLIAGSAIEEMLNLIETDMAFGINMILGKAGPLKQCEWEIESHDNQNVKIDLLYYQVDDEDYRIRLSYDEYADEELEELLQLKENDKHSVQDDL